MGISPKALRRLARAVDDQHRAALDAMPIAAAPLAEGPVDPAVASSRRSFLRTAVMGGAAVAVGSSLVSLGRLVPPAWAELGPSDADAVAFARSLELAATAAYKQVTSAGVLTDTAGQAAGVFGEHHREYANALGGLLGAGSAALANTTLTAQLQPALTSAIESRNATALVQTLYDLENALVATHLVTIGTIEVGGAAAATPTTAAGEAGAAAAGATTRPVAAGVLASIAPVESQHAVVLGGVLGLPLTTLVPSVQTTAGAYTPSAYPVA